MPRPLASAIALLLCLCAPLAAQTTGTITGRIFNPASGEYVRNARISVEGTGLQAVSEDGGAYVLGGLPAGTVRLNVTFTGYRTETATVTVAAGAAVTRDFELISALAAPAPDGTVRLERFVISSEREGNAKAIMEQRNSMNITNSVASDVFGDVAEGNVGEFLKHMPGVELDLVQGEIRTIRLRGLDSEYTQVTLDGVSLASADANQGASGNARAFSFEQVSLASMESIEVSKTISADVDANAPARFVLRLMVPAAASRRRRTSRPSRRASTWSNPRGPTTAAPGRFIPAGSSITRTSSSIGASA